MKKAAHVFKTHKDVDKVFLTSDGLVFFKDNDAINHAKSLKDRKVTPVTRSEAMDEEDEEDPEFEMPEGEPSEEWTNAQLHKYCEQVNIEIKASATKAELLEAINKAD